MYGHAITRGGTKVTITPSSSPVVWVPQAPAVGGEHSTTPPDFSADTLGAFLPSHDTGGHGPGSQGGVPKYVGMVRSVFEVKAKANGSGGEAAYSIEPGAPTGTSLLWLVLLKKVEVPGNTFVCVDSNVLG